MRQPLLLTLAFVCLIAHALLQNPPRPRYRGFAGLQWASTSGWKEQDLGSDTPAAERSVTFTPRQSFERWASAISKPVELNGNRVIFETLGAPPARFAIEFRLADGQVFKQRPAITPSTAWSRIEVDLPAEAINKTAEIALIAEQPTVVRTDRVLSFRDRIAFFKLRWPGAPSPYAWTAGAAGIFLFVWVILQAHGLRLSPWRIYPIYLFAAAAVFFHTTLFFNWDEWDVLHRMMTDGAATALRPHNEHFIPLFFLLYRAEALLFGDAYGLYLFLTMAIHALNAVLLAGLLERFVPRKAGLPPQLFWAAGMLYLVNALHSEVLEWAFEISIAAAQCATLLAASELIDFIADGKKRRLFSVAALAGAAPLIFGNGLVAPLQAGVLAAAFVVLTGPSRPAALRLVLGGVCALLPCISDFLAYSHFAPQPPGTPGIAETLALNGDAIFDYLFVGSQLGAILRSTGVYPSLDLDAGSRTLAVVLDYLPSLTEFVRAISPEGLFARTGFVLSLIALAAGTAIYWSDKSRRWFPAVCYLTGQAFILITMLLPALGRWKFGVFQSLAARYHYQTLPGVFVLLLPLLLAAFSALAGKKSLKSAAIALVIALHLALTLRVNSNFDYFTAAGAQNKQFVSELEDWEKKNGAAGAKYEGEGEMSGLYPIAPERFTPGLHPIEAYAVLNGLNPNRYPQTRR